MFCQTYVWKFVTSIRFVCDNIGCVSDMKIGGFLSTETGWMLFSCFMIITGFLCQELLMPLNKEKSISISKLTEKSLIAEEELHWSIRNLLCLNAGYNFAFSSGEHHLSLLMKIDEVLFLVMEFVLYESLSIQYKIL